MRVVIKRIPTDLSSLNAVGVRTTLCSPGWMVFVVTISTDGPVFRKQRVDRTVRISRIQWTNRLDFKEISKPHVEGAARLRVVDKSHEVLEVRIVLVSSSEQKVHTEILLRFVKVIVHSVHRECPKFRWCWPGRHVHTHERNARLSVEVTARGRIEIHGEVDKPVHPQEEGRVGDSKTIQSTIGEELCGVGSAHDIRITKSEVNKVVVDILHARERSVAIVRLQSGSDGNTRRACDGVERNERFGSVVALDRESCTGAFTPTNKVVTAGGVIQVNLDGVEPPVTVVVNGIRV